MGREIIYCWKCASRLNGDDFARGKAFRHGDKVACAECVYELVADLSAEEQEAILHPEKAPGKKPSSTKIKAAGGATTQLRRAGVVPRTRTGMTDKIPVSSGGGTRSLPKREITRSIPRAAPPPPEGEAGAEEAGEDPAKKKKKILLLAGGGGLLVVIIAVVLVVLLSGGKKVPREELADPADAKPKFGVKKTEAKAESPKDHAAGKVFSAGQKFKTDNPNDLAAQWKIWTEAVESCKGSSYEGKPEAELKLIEDKVEREIADVQAQCDKLMENEEFKKIFDLWQGQKSKYELECSAAKAETKIKQYQGMMDERFRNAKKEIVRADDMEQKRAEVVKRISTWGFPEKVAEISNFKGEEEAAADPANPVNPDVKAPVAKAMSAEMKAFLPVWQAAVLPAYARDYTSAVDALSKAGKDAEADEVKKAAAADAEDLRRAVTILDEGRKLAAEMKRLDPVTLEYRATPSEWRKVTGKVVRTDPYRVELATDQKDKPKMFVEFADLAASSLAEFYLARAPSKDPDAEKLAAIACLLEGNVDAAKKLAGRQLGRVPERFWQFATEIRERAPKPSAREFEARDLFLRAELEYRDVATRGPALEKYRVLMSDYAGSEYVKRNTAVMAGRMDAAKEYVLTPNDLRTPGTMNTFQSTKKYAPKAELALVTTKEIDFQACAENYIQIQFYALPNTAYRCWMLIGGCCAETMTFYYQTTEGKAMDKGKEKSIEPGGRAIDTLVPPIPGLAKEHAKHKPKDPKAPHPKEPTRWDWVELKLPKQYAAPGAKEIRIFTEQPGFGIGYVLVTSTRGTMPDAKVKAELDRDLAAGASEAPVVKGSPEPSEWRLIGPFNEPLAAQEPPETEIDLAKSYPGKKDKVEWKKVTAVWKSPTALFEWDKNGQVAPKDGVSVYALIYVKAPSAIDGQLWLGHDDGCRVWMNGQLVHSVDKASKLAGDEHKKKIQIKEGWNKFLFKVSNKSGTFGLAVRWVDAGGKPLDGLEFSSDADLIEKK